MPKEFFFNNNAELTNVLGARLGEVLINACKKYGKATFIASGGCSPKKIYRYLSRLNLPWENISVTLTDERYLPTNDPDSNEGMLRQELLINLASAAKFISLYSEDKPIDDAIDNIKSRLNTLALPATCVLLGMGTDGHTASLFPGADNLATSLDMNASQLCCPIIAPGVKQKRISLTASTLLNTKLVILLIIGDEKRTVYEKAKNGVDKFLMPIRTILHQRQIPVEVYWSP